MGGELTQRSVQTGRARIVAICDTDPEALATRSAEFDAEPVERIENLLGRQDVDAFLIAPPGGQHHPCLMALAPDGKPIFTEKPLATTAADCDEIIAACAQHGSKLFVGQVLRLFPAFWKSLELIESGAIGVPSLVSVTRAGRGNHYSTGWRASQQESGGPILETNSHELDYLNALLGEPESVYATGKNLNGWGDYNESYFVQVKYRAGGVGMLHGSNASPTGEYRVHIQGTGGSMIHSGFGGDIKYSAFADSQPTVIKREDLSDLLNPYDRELLSFFDWVEHDTPPLFTGETGRANVAIADAVNRSFASGQVEPVE
jgi:predicted dehydrogenase